MRHSIRGTPVSARGVGELVGALQLRRQLAGASGPHGNIARARLCMRLADGLVQQSSIGFVVFCGGGGGGVVGWSPGVGNSGVGCRYASGSWLARSVLKCEAPRTRHLTHQRCRWCSLHDSRTALHIHHRGLCPRFSVVGAVVSLAPRFGCVPFGGVAARMVQHVSGASAA